MIHKKPAPMGVTVKLKSAAVELTMGKNKKEKSRHRLVMTRPNKHKNKPKELTKQARSTINRKDKTTLQAFSS